jgi:hypothetical protein
MELTLPIRAFKQLDHTEATMKPIPAQQLSQQAQQAQQRELLRIDIPVPCNASWDEMTGDLRVRHCKGCQQNVVNLSAMTAAEGAALIAADLAGNLCVRIDTRRDGSILAGDDDRDDLGEDNRDDDARPTVRQPWRSLPGMAGAAVLALSAAGCYAAEPPRPVPAAAGAAAEPDAPPAVPPAVPKHKPLVRTAVAGTPAAAPSAPAPAAPAGARRCEKNAVYEQVIGKPRGGHAMPYVLRDGKGFCTR